VTLALPLEAAEPLSTAPAVPSGVPVPAATLIEGRFCEAVGAPDFEGLSLKDGDAEREAVATAVAGAVGGVEPEDRAEDDKQPLLLPLRRGDGVVDALPEGEVDAQGEPLPASLTLPWGDAVAPPVALVDGRGEREPGRDGERSALRVGLPVVGEECPPVADKSGDCERVIAPVSVEGVEEVAVGVPRSAEMVPAGLEDTAEGVAIADTVGAEEGSCVALPIPVREARSDSAPLGEGRRDSVGAALALTASESADDGEPAGDGDAEAVPVADRDALLVGVARAVLPGEPESTIAVAVGCATDMDGQIVGGNLLAVGLGDSVGAASVAVATPESVTSLVGAPEGALDKEAQPLAKPL